MSKLNNVLKYVGLNLDKVPETFAYSKPQYKNFKSYDDSKVYKVYREVPIKDIEIFLCDCDRTTEILERYKKAIDLHTYIEKFKDDFEKLAEQTNEDKIKETEEQRKMLTKELPFFIRYDKNYLWQIFYSRDDDKYFMLFPTEEGDSTLLFYLIKEQLKKSTKKVFIPICLEDPDSNILTFAESTDLENYIWLFTKRWPNTLEVSNNKETYLAIVGEAELYGGFKSKYKVELHSRDEALNFYTLTKALFILETETNYREKIYPIINSKGELSYLYEDTEITIDNLSKFITDQINQKNDMVKNSTKTLREFQENTKSLQEEIDLQKKEYSNLEKRIVLFLDCKKSFFKKIRFFFKKGQRFKLEEEPKREVEEKKAQEETQEKYNNTMEDLVKVCKLSSKTETELKNAKADYNIVLLKHKNMSKKIENAKKYINEIEDHKKSIFEFWKFANKDSLIQLNEGEETEQESEKQNLLKTYDMDTERKDFEVDCDSLIRRKLSTEEQNAIFIARDTLATINALNIEQEKGNSLDLTTENYLEKLIDSQYEELKINCKTDIRQEILGNLQDDYTKVKKLSEKEHRENKKDIYSVLKFNRETTLEEYIDKIKNNIPLINEALNKITTISELSVYYLEDKDEILDQNERLFIASMNPIELLTEYNGETQTICKVDVKANHHLVYLSNIIYYDNLNNTLPLGMDENKEVLIKVKNNGKNKIKEMNIVIEKNDFEVQIQKIQLIEIKSNTDDNEI